eukprot:12888365-Prorocentrum_lima.AAC.1
MLWEISTSAEAARRGPLLISQMQGTSRTFMVARLEVTGTLFTTGGTANYNGHMLTAIGLQHVIVTLGQHFKEQDQEEIL